MLCGLKREIRTTGKENFPCAFSYIDNKWKGLVQIITIGVTVYKIDKETGDIKKIETIHFTKDLLNHFDKDLLSGKLEIRTTGRGDTSWATLYANDKKVGSVQNITTGTTVYEMDKKTGYRDIKKIGFVPVPFKE